MPSGWSLRVVAFMPPLNLRFSTSSGAFLHQIIRFSVWRGPYALYWFGVVLFAGIRENARTIRYSALLLHRGDTRPCSPPVIPPI
ncbi:hypothetical protein EJ08DRAFT_654752 [Tothia fuscella]|uniref:Uncharacterized protein n=1 Tax=Tothia fuscella TaxID=1048955 RepID=A0A9P4NE58_9PEZI|nr:hypothetical protein EJ08DRAFT_654752 [Tothia fuscella]